MLLDGTFYDAINTTVSNVDKIDDLYVKLKLLLFSELLCTHNLFLLSCFVLVLNDQKHFVFLIFAKLKSI